MTDSACIEVYFLVSSTDSKGGIGRMAEYLRRELAESAPKLRLRIVPTRWSERPLLKHVSTLPALVVFGIRCAASRPDIVHINVAPRGSTYRKYLYFLVARRFGAKIVLHLHGSGYDEFFQTEKPAFKQIIRRFFRGADHVVVLGKYWKNFAVQELGAIPTKLSVIYNGVPEPTTSNITKCDPPLLVTMGLIGERKGTDVLIAALAALPSSIRWRAALGGNGEVAKYRNAAAKAGLSDRTDFLGWVDEDEVDLWLKRASVFVLPSRAENQPVAILEAMARAVPVIATSVGAIPEQVVDGRTGLLVPPGDPGPLRAAIERMLTSPEERCLMGVAARKRYEQHFSSARCAIALQRIYRSLVDCRVQELRDTCPDEQFSP